MHAKVGRGSRYSQAVKRKAVARIENGDKPIDIAREIGCHVSSLHNWNRKYTTKQKTKMPVKAATFSAVPVHHEVINGEDSMTVIVCKGKGAMQSMMNTLLLALGGGK